MWDRHVHTVIFKTITNKDLFCTAHGMLCDSLDGRGVWGRMDTNICMAGSLHCSPETITTLLVIWLYPNTKFKVLKTNKKSWLRERQPDAIQILCIVL